MTGKEVYRKWAPVSVKWIDWVRPVPFICINDNYRVNEFFNLKIPDINYLDSRIENSAIIVDLYGLESINEGIGLAKKGYRPIPIYNGTMVENGIQATTNNNIIGMGLIWGGNELEKISLDIDAPPAFLLDSSRMNRLKMDSSVFDNSWDIYHQDLPSAEYFLKNNINKIIIVGEKIQSDLNKILYNFQKKGIDIFFTNGYEKPKIIRLKKPHCKKDD